MAVKLLSIESSASCSDARRGNGDGDGNGSGDGSGDWSGDGDGNGVVFFDDDLFTGLAVNINERDYLLIMSIDCSSELVEYSLKASTGGISHVDDEVGEFTRLHAAVDI